MQREIWIYLPPSYERDRTRHYPVLYLLHGMTSHPREWLDGSYQGFDLRVAMDSLARLGHEYLIVTPYADNAWGGPFYVNSVAFGRWDDFVGRELVGYVDGKYRTMRDRRHRGIAGQSMGGFGALSLAINHSATFANVYAMSPCCLAMAGELGGAHPVWQRAPQLALSAKPQNVAESIVRDLSAWVDHFSRTDIPVLADTAETLEALRLNEDLVEAIGLGHDLGHAPFGHAGEAALSHAQGHSFRHNEQSRRVVEVLEKDGQGLNLTYAVREGIYLHSKARRDIMATAWGVASTLEGQIIKIAKFRTMHVGSDAKRGAVIGSAFDAWMMVPGWVRGQTKPEVVGPVDRT